MDLMDLAHLHLLLNHVPTIGIVVGLGVLLLVAGSPQRPPEARQLRSLLPHRAPHAARVPDGVAAQQAIQGGPDVSEPAIVTHHDAAMRGFLMMQFTGLAAWLGSGSSAVAPRPAAWTSAAVLVLAVVDCRPHGAGREHRRRDSTSGDSRCSRTPR